MTHNHPSPITHHLSPITHHLSPEWVVIAYLLFTLVVMAIWWPQLVNPVDMLIGRGCWLLATLTAWLFYYWCPSRWTMLLRVTVQLAFLSWWYPDTYELNRVLPNLDHLFAAADQTLFGCQPSLLFSQQVPWGWFSELMCLGYVSYFPLIVLVVLYYFVRRYHEFVWASTVILAAFFAYYVVFVLVPVTGPQFYYPAVGFDKIAAGVFPDLGNWFLTHDFRMPAPGWSDGFFYHLLDVTHDSGERPTAAFPSSHVGITTVLFLLALRTRCRWLSGILLFFLILMCMSTVYIFAHYLVDVLAGLVTALLFYALFYYLSVRFVWNKKTNIR